jgi:hypothetical protein
MILVRWFLVVPPKEKFAVQPPHEEKLQLSHMHINKGLKRHDVLFLASFVGIQGCWNLLFPNWNHLFFPSLFPCFHHVTSFCCWFLPPVLRMQNIIQKQDHAYLKVLF